MKRIHPTQMIMREIQKITKLALLLSISCLLNVQGAFAQFNISTLNNTTLTTCTSIQFGPDGRLYAGQVNGIIRVFTVERTGANDYTATYTETINHIKEMANHDDDDGSLHTDKEKRELTGIYVAGTADKPIIYATSSDYRQGGPTGDLNLDTNSGVVSKLEWKYPTAPANTDFSGLGLKDEDTWDKVDLVRGLPRSEENHATNALELVTIGGKPYLLVCSGGHTNAGSPSSKLAMLTEFALAAAILSVDLDAIDALPVNGTGYEKYIYDLPTVDDPTRDNVNGITDPDANGYNGVDVNDPWGGNDGLNQAKLVQGGPVQIFSPGWRNTYDLVVTTDGRVYATDNGANKGWGGMPVGENPPSGGVSTATNDYHIDSEGNEIGSTDGIKFNGQSVNNKDHLHLVAPNLQTYTFNSFYAGHPTPIRANPDGAGLWTQFGANGVAAEGIFRTVKYDPNGSGDAADPDKALPADWPPVPLALANPIEGDYLSPGDDDGGFTYSNNTNGIDEYSANNLDNAYKGNLIMGNDDGFLFRVILNPDGSVASIDEVFASGFQNPLGITCQGSLDVFPGTIWVGDYGGFIKILEPIDFDGNQVDECFEPSDAQFVGTEDYDNDNYTNADEIDNGTDHCSGSIFPSDFDNDFLSDLNDDDDDGDGTNDVTDVLQLGTPRDLPVNLELFTTLEDGYLGLGFTGLMNNLDPNDDYLNWLDVNGDGPAGAPNDVYGGTNGSIAIQITDGTAAGSTNDQDKGFQFGMNVDASTGVFTVESQMIGPFHSHGAGETQSFFIGTGDQDNYIKLALGQNGIEMVTEFGGNMTTPSGYSTTDKPASTPGGLLVLMFTIDPVNGTIQPKYAVNGGPENNLGEPYTVPAGAILNAIQLPDNPLVAGLMGTAATGTEFNASWDYFKAYKGGSLGSSDDLDVVFRVNAGGPEVGALDNNISWDGDDQAGYIYRNSTSGKSTYDLTDYTYSPSIPAYAPNELFATERWDRPSVEANMIWSFPVDNGEDYVVRLYLANGYDGTKFADQREYSIQIEGVTVNEEVDMSEEFGHQVGVMMEYVVSMQDDSLNIEFVRDVENPSINAIEIIRGSEAPSKELATSLTTVAFGSQQEGTTSAPKVKTLTNVGNTEMTVTNVTVSGEDAAMFSTNFSGPVDLEPGASTTFNITFAPTSTGAKTADLNIIHDGDNDSPMIVSLSGSGTSSTISADASAYISIKTGDDIDGSTFGGGFKIFNNSTNGLKITKVSFDLSTALYPDLVFDPLGGAGDASASCFTANQGTETSTGLITDGSGSGTGSCETPYSGPNGGGFEIIEMTFNDFDPGEDFIFGGDIDPTSVSTNAEEGASISGFELMGTTVTVEFEDGTVISSRNVGMIGSVSGSETCLNDGMLAAPGISVAGAANRTSVANANQTVTITGPADSTVSLFVVESGFITPDPAGFDEFYANKALSIAEYSAEIGSGGTVDINVALPDTDQDENLYYIAAGIRGGDSCVSTISDIITLKLDPSSSIVDLADGGEFRIFPNPASQQATLRFTGKTRGELDVRVRDMSGKIVAQASWNKLSETSETLIDISSLADGMYIVQIAGEGISINERLVKMQR
ncbi:MAG: malectin domain-containing carbohydrate-binding protein [Bacteroidota bacterium]